MPIMLSTRARAWRQACLPNTLGWYFMPGLTIVACVCVYVVRGPAGTIVSRRCVLQNLSVFDDGWWGIFHLDWLKVVTQTIRHLICVFVFVVGAVACRVTFIYEMLSLKCDFMLLCIADLGVGFFLFFSVNHALHICTVVNKYKCMQEI